MKMNEENEINAENAHTHHRSFFPQILLLFSAQSSFFFSPNYFVKVDGKI